MILYTSRGGDKVRERWVLPVDAAGGLPSHAFGGVTNLKLRRDAGKGRGGKDSKKAGWRARLPECICLQGLAARLERPLSRV